MEKKLLDYWIILYKRKKSIAIVTVTSLLVTIVLGWLLKPVYEARVICYVPSTSPALTFLSNSPTSSLARDRLVPTSKDDDAGPYLGLLKSTRIAELTHKDFPEKKISKLLRSDMSFELSDEFMLKIYSRDSDPVLAANVANAYLKHLNTMLQDASSKNPEQDRILLTGQLTIVENKLKGAKDSLRNFSEQNNIASIDEETKTLTSQKITFQATADNTAVMIGENEEKIKASLEQLKKEGNILAENDFILSSPTLDYMRNKLSDLTAQIGGQSIELKESHPDIKILKSQYRDVTDKLKKEVQNLVMSQIKPKGSFYEELRQSLANLIIEKNRLQATLKGNKAVIERINNRIRTLPSINAEWSRLNDDIDHYRKIYDEIRTNLQEATMQEARPIQYVVVVDYAVPPKNPVFPIMWLNIAVALFFGLAAGIAYAYLIEYISETRQVRTMRLIKAIVSDPES
jgi:uncharacterized protein involved in exopolysaccharide biosynthesis